MSRILAFLNLYLPSHSGNRNPKVTVGTQSCDDATKYSLLACDTGKKHIDFCQFLSVLPQTDRDSLRFRPRNIEAVGIFELEAYERGVVAGGNVTCGRQLCV